LKKEIEYIKNFINLQNLLSAKVYSNFNYNEEISEKFLLPCILITFVENAFKHGLYNDPEFPILINLTAESRLLLFSIENRKKKNKSGISSNTGLDNVTQILELYYPSKYKLNFEEDVDYYKVNLVLQFD
jgi:two-component system LytT family sensor kinase